MPARKLKDRNDLFISFEYMRIICLIISLLSFWGSEIWSQSNLQELYDKAIINGTVDYPKLLEYKSILESEKINLVEAFNASMPSSSEWTAHAINLYNLLVLDKILDHYPVESVEQIKSFFTQKLMIGENQMSLDEFEQLIFEKTEDPRIHFVLNCAARSCPEIPAKLLNVQSLDRQLDLSVVSALSKSHIVDIDESTKTLNLNQVFKWYHEDFEKSSVLGFISEALNRPELKEYKIKYQLYDWSLNSYQAIRYVASRLYEKGEYEIHLFNNYYTQRENGDPTENNFGRYNFLNHFFQATIGLNNKINIGLGLKFRSVSQNLKSLSGTLDALKYRNDGFIFNQDAELEGYTRAGLTAIYPSIKYAPFKSNKNISVYHALFIPVGYALEGNADFGYLDWEGFSLQSNLSYNYDTAPDKSIYLDAALILENIDGHLFGKGTGFSQIGFAFNYIHNFFPNNEFNYYSLINVAPRISVSVMNETAVEFIPYAQVGGGFKYYINRNLESELLYTFFYDGTENRISHTFNVGLRYYGI